MNECMEFLGGLGLSESDVTQLYQDNGAALGVTP